MDANTVQMFLAMLSPIVLQWLKNQPKFTLLCEASSKFVKVAFSAGAAVLSSVGVTVTCDFHVAHNCVVNGLDWHTVQTLALRTASQFIAQHIIHAGLKAYANSK